MYTLPEPVKAEFDDRFMHVTLEDGNMYTVPLARYPLLLAGTPAQRAAVEFSPAGLHWDELDEDISVRGIIAVSGESAAQTRHAA